MPDTANLSATKRALLQKYLRGNLPHPPSDAGSIPRRASTGHAPLSFAQEQMWLHSQIISAVPIYNDCLSIHLPGQLDAAALARSLNEVIRRHDILRTTFPIVDEQPVQVVQPYAPLPLPVIDLRHLPEAEREAEALRMAREDVRQLFDLAQGPLFRARLVRLGDEEHRLFWSVQHLIGDGVAWYHVFLPELGVLYEAFSRGQPSPLPEPAFQYADYAAWQRQQAQEETFAEHLAYWKQQLAGAPTALELPTDYPRAAHRSYRGSLRPFALPKRLTLALKELSRQEGVTLFTTLVAAFDTLLYRYTGQEDMVFGTASAGRRHPAVQKAMGCFLNAFVLRTDLSGNPSFRELVQRVRQVISAALDHDELPFVHLVKELHPKRSIDQHPFCQVMIVLEPLLPALPPGWVMSQMEVTAGTSWRDLSLELDDRPDEGIIGRFTYRTDLFTADTIERMVGHWLTLLENIVADPDRSIAALPLSPDAEPSTADGKVDPRAQPAQAERPHSAPASGEGTPQGKKMSDLDRRIAALSPEKREMLLRQLHKQKSRKEAHQSTAKD